MMPHADPRSAWGIFFGILMDFAQQIRDFSNKVKEKTDDIVRGVATKALDRVKELTPVDTGYLRAGFSVTTDPVNVKYGDSSEIKKLKAGDTFYIVNPVEYARRIEYGFIGKDSLGRSYNQAGQGMVQQTIKELPKIIKDVVAELK